MGVIPLIGYNKDFKNLFCSLVPIEESRLGAQIGMFVHGWTQAYGELRADVSKIKSSWANDLIIKSLLISRSSLHFIVGHSFTV